ncbi:unnamed protein product [Arctogadus glacialis]
MTTTCEDGVSVVQPRCFICDEHHLQGLGSIKSQEMVQRPLFSLASPWASLVQASALLFTLRFLCSMYTNIHPSLPLLNLRRVFICVFPFTHLQISPLYQAQSDLVQDGQLKRGMSSAKTTVEMEMQVSLAGLTSRSH